MLRTWFKKRQIEHKNIKVFSNQNFQFHFHYRVMSWNVLIKTRKPPLCHHYATVQMVCWLSSSPSKLRTQFKSRLCQFLLFSKRFFFTANWYLEHLSTCFWTIQIILCDLRLKLGQNSTNSEVSFKTPYSSVQQIMHSIWIILQMLQDSQ